MRGRPNLKGGSLSREEGKPAGRGENSSIISGGKIEPLTAGGRRVAGLKRIIRSIIGVPLRGKLCFEKGEKGGDVKKKKRPSKRGQPSLLFRGGRKSLTSLS